MTEKKFKEYFDGTTAPLQYAGVRAFARSQNQVK